MGRPGFLEVLETGAFSLFLHQPIVFQIQLVLLVSHRCQGIFYFSICHPECGQILASLPLGNIPLVEGTIWNP